MKALEVVRRELQNNYEKRPFIIKREIYHKGKIEDFHEAIEELERLEQSNKELLNTVVEARKVIKNLLEGRKWKKD